MSKAVPDAKGAACHHRNGRLEVLQSFEHRSYKSHMLGACEEKELGSYKVYSGSGQEGSQDCYCKPWPNT